MATSSTGLEVWVKEATSDDDAFSVMIPANALVDHLKKAIKNEESLECAASKLKIKVGEEVLKPTTKVSEIIGANDGEHPIFFTQPPGKPDFTVLRHIPCICEHTPSLLPPFFL